MANSFFTFYTILFLLADGETGATGFQFGRINHRYWELFLSSSMLFEGGVEPT